MHMADALLSPGVGATMCAVSAGAVAYCIRKVKRDELSPKKLPVMAVSGAFVFAAQMINFTIPATGSSGHIGGGILLAALLGGYPALLAITAVLTIQCLFFADGGLLALGCNIFNMGVIPCLIVYPLLFKPIMQKGKMASRLTLAAISSVVLGLQAGAFAVVLETLASGITALPFTTFTLMMQPIHLAIGIVEGIVTAGVLGFVHSLRPELLESVQQRVDIAGGIAMRKLIAVLAVVTLCTAGGLSLYAASEPDGLEWSIERVAGSAELEAEGEAFTIAAAIQEATAWMPDYDFSSESQQGFISGTTVAGIVGAIMTFTFAGVIGAAVSRLKRRKQASGL